MLYSIIDIGSSIIKYKIYEYDDDKIEPIITNDRTTGLISYRKNNKLTDEGIKLLVNTLRDFKEYSTKLHVDHDYYYATASLRNLENEEEILNYVKKELNIDIIVLSGKQEANFSFKSINFVQTPSNSGIVVDIGGGSSEITIFEEDNISEQKSIPLGVLSIYNNYVSQLIPDKKEQEIIINNILKKMEELNIKHYAKEYIFAIGKTFISIEKLFKHMKIKNDSDNIITIEQVEDILDILCENKKNCFKPLLQIDSERVHTMIPSLLIIKALAMQFNVKKIFVCDTTLQDGIIINKLKK